jgi:hypothetical protein
MAFVVPAGFLKQTSENRSIKEFDFAMLGEFLIVFKLKQYGSRANL